MDLSPGQRSAVFALIVVVLAVLGYFLVAPALTRSHASARAAASPSATPPAVTSVPPAAVPTVTAPAAAAGGVNIYSWLPFTQQDLATAASAAVQVSIDYNTYTYTETGAGYVAKMGGLITGRPVGAAVGAITGGTIGAIAGAQAAARPGYYLAQGNCYYKYPSGQYVQVDPRSCY